MTHFVFANSIKTRLGTLLKAQIYSTGTLRLQGLEEVHATMKFDESNVLFQLDAESIRPGQTTKDSKAGEDVSVFFKYLGDA